MRLNLESEKYFNRGENQTHDLDVAVVVSQLRHIHLRALFPNIYINIRRGKETAWFVQKLQLPPTPGKMFTLHLWTRSVAGCRIPDKLFVAQLTRLIDCSVGQISTRSRGGGETKSQVCKNCIVNLTKCAHGSGQWTRHIF